MSTTVETPFGRASAPPGTEAWAERWRIDFQAVVIELGKFPDRAENYLEIGEKFRAWTLLKTSTGRPFRSFDEFCEAPKPHGLGMPPAKFRELLAIAHGKRTVSLVTAAPDGRRDNRRGGKGDESTPGAENHRTPDVDTRMRAILRAPEPVQALYREGLIGQKDAAKLGPKPTRKQAPEDVGAMAARVAEIAHEAARVVADEKPVTEADKRRVQRKVNAVVREKLGTKPRSPVFGVEALWTAITALPESDQKTIRDRLVRTWGSVNT